MKKNMTLTKGIQGTQLLERATKHKYLFVISYSICYKSIAFFVAAQTD